jgi:hypothetical protein
VQNVQSSWNNNIVHSIGRWESGGSRYVKGQYSDQFFIDGQALTPDVFGFNKVGKGYISVGSTQATDFRPGQWVPKSPRIIIADINSRGGFGVNGFYLPMNDSNNFGADFHCTPNSIIKLQENLQQPRCRIDGVGDYTGALRDDPFKQYLVLALPFVSGGLQNGLGDYSAAIKGSGTPKTITNSNVSIASTASYYGSVSNFTSASSSYLTTPRNIQDYNMGSGDFTVEGWFYFKSINTGQWTRFFSIGNGSAGNEEGILFEIEQSTSIITFYSRDNAGNNLINGPVVIAGQWYHMALCRKSSTVSAYVNGVCVGTANISTRVVNFTSNTAVIIGAWENQLGSYTRFADAYIQDLRVYKGVAKYTGGFDVPRPYTPVGIATWRQVPDTTANNFATLNGTSIPSKYTLSNGNLTFVNSTTNWTGWLEGTVGFSTGKYYWETRIDVSSDYHHIGIVGVGITHFNSADAYRYGISYQTDGRYYAENNLTNHFQTGITQSKTVGDIVMLAVDVTNKRMWIGKNGTWFSGDPSNASSPPFDSTRGFNYAHYVPFYDSYGSSGLSINFGQNPTFSGNTTAGTFTDTNGKGLFKYQPPSGFLALCEDNLPTPAISDPGKHFRTVLWTGDGNNGRSIDGVGFQPDLVWIKNRNSSTWHVINDSVRGPNRALYSNQTYAENQTASNPVLGSVLSFNSDGFSLAVDPDSNGNNGWNNSGNSIVAWCWKAGNTTTTNTNGSITSVVSANQDAGFSIVSFTMPSGTYTVGHGLGKTPKFIITKQRDGSYGWWTQHASIGAGTAYLDLSSTAASTSLSWGGIPNSSTFAINNSYAVSGQRVIAYCWAEIEGFSKFGSYVGNGNADGPFVYCGFRPAFVIIKRTDSGGSWVLKDSSRNSTNPADLSILAQASDTEYSSNSPIDFLSNGFKLRSSSLNDTSGTFIFAAWAESPFQTANAK